MPWRPSVRALLLLMESKGYEGTGGVAQVRGGHRTSSTAREALGGSAVPELRVGAPFCGPHRADRGEGECERVARHEQDWRNGRSSGTAPSTKAPPTPESIIYYNDLSCLIDRLPPPRTWCC